MRVLCTGEKKVFTANMTIGTVLAIAGFAGYSYLKLMRGRRPSLLLPLANGDAEPMASKKDSGVEAPHKDRGHHERREEMIRAHPTVLK